MEIKLSLHHLSPTILMSHSSGPQPPIITSGLSLLSTLPLPTTTYNHSTSSCSLGSSCQWAPVCPTALTLLNPVFLQFTENQTEAPRNKAGLVSGHLLMNPGLSDFKLCKTIRLWQWPDQNSISTHDHITLQHPISSHVPCCNLFLPLCPQSPPQMQPELWGAFLKPLKTRAGIPEVT
jgi:hypothetical protein